MSIFLTSLFLVIFYLIICLQAQYLRQVTNHKQTINAATDETVTSKVWNITLHYIITDITFTSRDYIDICIYWLPQIITHRLLVHLHPTYNEHRQTLKHLKLRKHPKHRQDHLLRDGDTLTVGNIYLTGEEFRYSVFLPPGPIISRSDSDQPFKMSVRVCVWPGYHLPRNETCTWGTSVWVLWSAPRVFCLWGRLRGLGFFFFGMGSGVSLHHRRNNLNRFINHNRIIKR